MFKLICVITIAGLRLNTGESDCVKDSCDWTKVEPEVTKLNEIQTYSLQAEGGRFECSLSALRWVSKEPISFKYQFGSWEEHKEVLASMDSMVAGPLLDITVTEGKLEEVYLPHWIDTESTISEMFEVLHIDSCGISVEQVSEVTPSHVKLLQPAFSPKGVIFRMKLGLPVRVYRDVLIFKTKQEFLTLHVYVIPPDRHLQETVESKESSFGSILIPKPSPDKSLQMQDHFFLTTDTNNAEIQPARIKLRTKYEGRIYFEVFIRNAENDFSLKLKTEKKNNVEDFIWACTIRKGDYKGLNTEHVQDQHFVDRHRTALINRVKDTRYILDKLLEAGLISNEKYDSIRVTAVEHEQMREILKCVKSAGRKGKDIFYKILKGMKNLKPLMSELEIQQMDTI